MAFLLEHRGSNVASDTAGAVHIDVLLPAHFLDKAFQLWEPLSESIDIHFDGILETSYVANVLQTYRRSGRPLSCSYYS